MVVGELLEVVALAPFLAVGGILDEVGLEILDEFAGAGSLSRLTRLPPAIRLKESAS